MTQPFKNLLWVSLVLLLTACGFHLRGQFPLPAPLYKLYVQTTEPYDPFIQYLQGTLEKMQVTLTPSPQQATAVLVIDDMHHSESLVSSSTTSQVNTYALIYTIRFSLQDPQGKVLLEPQTISASQNYTLSSNQAITGAFEQQQYQQQLYQSVLTQLFNRLNSQKVHQALG